MEDKKWGAEREKRIKEDADVLRTPVDPKMRFEDK